MGPQRDPAGAVAELALHVVITGQSVVKVVVNTDKGPCSP